MGAATNRVVELRAELAKAEKEAAVEAAAQREAERVARRTKHEADTDEYRQHEYEGFAGPHDSYVGLSSFGDGGIELSLNEFMSFSGSAVLTRDEALGLIHEIQKVLR